MADPRQDPRKYLDAMSIAMEALKRADKAVTKYDVEMYCNLAEAAARVAQAAK